MARFFLLIGLFISIFLMSVSFNTTAETPPEKKEVAARKIKAIKLETPPIIDGILDDECWKQVKPATEFIQQKPVEGQPAREQTFAYVAYDKDNIYVAFNCLSSNPDKIVTNISSRDGLIPRGPGSDMISFDDAVQVLLDTYYDHRNYYSFMVNARGTITDGKSSGGQFDAGTVWDCTWDARSSINEDGWSAEMEIPLCALRFNSTKGEQLWGINFRRSEKASGEETYWSAIGDNSSDPRGYGILTGLVDLSVKHFLDITPYFVARNTSKDGFDQSEGVDLEVLVTPNLTATATINPDFGQIEADPESFNLSRREMRLPEKRAFFKEGLELLGSPISIFYTRRMTDIEYGAKIAGKIGSTSVAALNVETRADEEESEATFTAVRLKQDVMKSASIGIYAVNKYWEGINNRIFSLDGGFNLGENMRSEFQFCKSFLPGKEDIAMTASFFRSGKNYFIYSKYEDTGPDFVAEPGIVTNNGEKELFAIGGSEIKIEKYGIKQIGTFDRVWLGMDYENKVISEGFAAEFNMKFKNKISISLNGERSKRVEEEEFHNFGNSIWLGYNTEEWTSTEVSFTRGRNYGQKMKRLRGSTNIKPADSLSIQISIDNLRLDETVSWINTVRLNYQFSKEMSLRVFGQMSWGKLTANILLRYEYQPGSNFYLAYNQTETDDGTDRIFFVKIAHVLGMYLDF